MSLIDALWGASTPRTDARGALRDGITGSAQRERRDAHDMPEPSRPTGAEIVIADAEHQPCWGP
jgi:hypothetical protein